MQNKRYPFPLLLKLDDQEISSKRISKSRMFTHYQLIRKSITARSASPLAKTSYSLSSAPDGSPFCSFALLIHLHLTPPFASSVFSYRFVSCFCWTFFLCPIFLVLLESGIENAARQGRQNLQRLGGRGVDEPIDHECPPTTVRVASLLGHIHTRIG